ncbi:FAD-binding oxidoreductase [Nitratireductor kimnyeongensis]|uniref:FAD-binding oxidoreductase n=1 Tax=Nitratireductor kimnyeongensis TaxID=430679 RepID=A0ABW0T6S9_9HYPH|nr:FAD-binding oxidoreductase [Nitratireductor kimnyeongensis]QZZ36461.1 FAD-binding oxidoreductase [Nitratireductor kimnyeongensis]
MSVLDNAAFDLLAELRKLVGTASQVDVTEAGLTEHSFDWWPVAAKWRQNGKSPCRPDAVVYPADEDEVKAILRWANEKRIPVTPWGLGSSVVGQPLTEYGGITLDLSRMNRILAVDTTNLIVRVEAGVMGGDLEEHLRGLGFTLNHSPQSLYRSTVGGWLATRATGQLSSRYGGIEDLAYSFNAVLADGSVLQTVDLPRMAVGPDLRHLMIGSEGTMGVITEVALKIFPLPEFQTFETVRFSSVQLGVDAMRAIMAANLRPSLLRFYDTAEARHAMQDKSFPSPVMFLGTEGMEGPARAEMEALRTICTKFSGELLGPQGSEAWTHRRFDFSTIESFVTRPEGVAETIEISNNWERIMDTYKLLTEQLEPMADEVLGHFSHVYTTGVSLYVILLGEAEDGSAAEERIRRIWEIAMEASLQTGASISHHHGAGLARGPYVQRALKSGAAVLQRVKDALDPNNILNPGKLGLRRP